MPNTFTKQNLREIIKRLAPTFALNFYRFLRERYFPRNLYRVISFSQNGEDRALWRYFEGQKSGFYVDIGAHHPFRFSNTCVFYDMGWRGINVDAMPRSMEAFQRYRKRDINIQCAVGDSRDFMDFSDFDMPRNAENIAGGGGAIMRKTIMPKIKMIEIKTSETKTRTIEARHF